MLLKRLLNDLPKLTAIDAAIVVNRARERGRFVTLLLLLKRLLISLHILTVIGVTIVVNRERQNMRERATCKMASAVETFT